MTAKNDSNKNGLASSMDDVSRPGKTPADSTSRPVIVGHRPLLKQDPMVSKTEEEAEASANNEDLKSTSNFSEHTLEPSNEAKEEAKEKTEEEEKMSSETLADEDQPPGASSAAVDALASEVSAKREAEKASEADVKKQLELEETIQSRKYFVPIGEVSKRRMNRIIIGILLLMLLTIAAINFAIDAELLDIGLQSLTDLL